MSFLSGIVNFLSGPIVGPLVGTVVAGYALKKVTSSIQRDQQAAIASSGADVPEKVDPGVRLQVDPDTETKIPVVYGSAFVGGKITDVRLSSDNQNLFLCLTLCEQTGPHIGGAPSVITFKDIYMDGQKINFQTNGITAASIIDADGNTDTRVNGKIEIACYSNGSANQVFPAGATGTPVDARNRFPEWTTQHRMTNLVFAIVKITYSPDDGITGVPNFLFEIQNTLTLPGDVLYDYMTSSRYGANIKPESIFVQ